MICGWHTWRSVLRKFQDSKWYSNCYEAIVVKLSLSWLDKISRYWFFQMLTDWDRVTHICIIELSHHWYMLTVIKHNSCSYYYYWCKRVHCAHMTSNDSTSCITSINLHGVTKSWKCMLRLDSCYLHILIIHLTTNIAFGHISLTTSIISPGIQWYIYQASIIALPLHKWHLGPTRMVIWDNI